LRPLIDPQELSEELGQAANRAPKTETDARADAIVVVARHLARRTSSNFDDVSSTVNELCARLSAIEGNKCAIPSYVPLFHVRRDERDLIVEIWVEYLPAPGGAAQWLAR